MIKELTQEEASRLRELVKSRFLSGSFNGAGFRISQHKASYKPLAEDIIRVVPSSAASITTHRLRKLFYYTDPEICATEKLEKPSFGDDFLQALFTYVKDEKEIPPALAPWRNVGLWSALLVVLVGVGAWLWPKQNAEWLETFDTVSVDSLKSRGWEILDYDSVAFSKQLKSGKLTLYTYPGGYWVKKDSGEIPRIKNMVVKKIDSKECLITTRLVDSFNPNQNWQGAGICIFGPDCNLDNNLMVFFAYATNTTIKDSVQHIQKVQAILLVNGKPYEHNWGVRLMNNIPVPLKEIEFELEIREKQVAVSFRLDASWRSTFLDKLHLDLPFYPCYVGLGAAQGHTDFSGKPLNADTIPAFFDFLKVEPLSE